METRTGQELLQTHSLMLGERLYLFARLRFLAAAGILVGGLFATYVVGIPGLDLVSLAGAAVFLAAYNVYIFLAVRPRDGAHDEQTNERRLASIAHVSILLDYLVLTFAIWQVGGASSPFLAFYLLHAILAAVLLSRRAAYGLAGVGYLCLTGLVLGEWWGLIPRHEVLGAPVDARLVATVLFVYGVLTAATIVLTTGVVRLLREHEQGLRVAGERLERLADIRRSFLHVVLHDLRSPVGTVVAMLEGLSGGLDGQLGEAQKSRVDRATARLRSSLELLRGLRVLADLETEGLESLMAPVDLRAVIVATVEEHQDVAEQKNQTLAVVLPDTLPSVHGIDRLIREALANYLTNAIKYSARGDTITVRAVPEGSIVRIEVSDNGPGVPLAEEAGLFQEFARAGKGGGWNKKAGLGLGLSIVRRIAEAHGGRAGFKRRAGPGSTFFIELPVRDVG
jgi:signal transduction histidine kinase